MSFLDKFSFPFTWRQLTDAVPDLNLTDALLNPKLTDEEQREILAKRRKAARLPVIWLLGKTQSGKSSIIQALTGSSRAVVGEGFRPCTRHTDLFDFPDEETAFIRFLDTRGLGEVGYDPTEDLAFCEKSASILIVTVAAMDHEQDAVLAAARAIRERHPGWPILVAHTCLHTGYTRRESEHPLPYPFADDIDAPCVPTALARSLRVQREAFADLDARFVPVDFTPPEEGYEPPHYGLDALWAAIEAALPIGLRALMTQDAEQARTVYERYEAKAHPHILGYAVSAGLAALTPLPAVGLPLVFALQGKLFHSIASIYGMELTARSVGEFLSSLGLGALSAGYGARELAKLIPGFGAAIAGLSTAALTYALGKTLCFYYAQTLQGEPFNEATLRAVYRREFDLGREALRQRFATLGKQEPA